jgi:hypothetical protein
MKPSNIKWPQKFLEKNGTPSVSKLLKSYLDLERKFHESTNNKEEK